MTKKDEIKIEENETFYGSVEILESKKYKSAFDKVGKLHIQEVLNSIEKDSEFFVSWLNQILEK